MHNQRHDAANNDETLIRFVRFRSLDFKRTTECVTCAGRHELCALGAGVSTASLNKYAGAPHGKGIGCPGHGWRALWQEGGLEKT